jgi:hypothetical protein
MWILQRIERMERMLVVTRAAEIRPERFHTIR